MLSSVERFVRSHVSTSQGVEGWIDFFLLEAGFTTFEFGSEKVAETSTSTSKGQQNQTFESKICHIYNQILRYSKARILLFIQL